LPLFAQAGGFDFFFSAHVSAYRVYALALQPDGKIIVAGQNLAFGTNPALTNVGRLNANGSNDTSFNPGTGADNIIYCAAMQPDGRILIGGDFDAFNGVTRRGIARLNSDGSLDPTFDSASVTSPVVTGIAVQPDGKILISGGFAEIGGQARSNLARLLANGILEDAADFAPTFGVDGTIFTPALQPDGKILLGGIFTTINGETRNRIARMNSDGSLESTTTFNPGTAADSTVSTFIVQPDGKIVIGGIFTTFAGQSRNRIARLNPDGSLEGAATFNAGTGANNAVLSMAMQTDGKILLVGSFSTVNGENRQGIARLHANGNVESTSTFNSAAADRYAIAIQSDGKLLIGGGPGSPPLARRLNDAAPRVVSVPDTSQVTWQRSGTSPEIKQVTFDLSPDGGTSWSPIGSGTRTSGGWQRTGLSLPTTGTIRARGHAASGYHAASSGLIEQTAAYDATPIGMWKLAQLGDSLAPDSGDPDKDGLATLAEYGLNTSPAVPDATPLTVERSIFPEGERLRVFLQRDPAHNDVTVEVQSADSVAGPWTTVATSALGAPFSGPGYVGGDSATPGIKAVEIRDTVNIMNAAQRLLRLKVTH
jgi:uncharacterized delta-60 repeat protein